MKRIIAAFDFDGTLTEKDSFIEFALHVRGKRRLLRACLEAAPLLLAWKLRLCEGGRAKERLFSRLYKGMTLEKFREYGATFAPAIRRMEKREMLDRMKRHVAEGHTVYIVSASVPEWIVPWAAEYGVPRGNVLGTGIETDERGCLTGRFSTPNCTGEEKIRRLAAAAGGTEGAVLYAYGNSSGDKPLLGIADYPVYIGK